MDRTRKADLEWIDEISKTANKAQLSELQDTKRKILAKSKDKKLVELRRQLINASRQGRGPDVRLLNERIRAYERSS